MDTAIDPICGMKVEKATAKYKTVKGGETYYFCNPKCQKKFEEGGPVSASSSGTYYCPMDPEVIENKPGSCPKCGMALLPLEPQKGDPEELIDMRRRCLTSLPFASIIMILSMIEVPFGGWLESILATPVVCWGALPILKKTLDSIRNLSLNMFTLIGLGIVISYVFSLILVLFPDLNLAKGGFFFEAAAGITVLVLWGQWIEMRARGRAQAAFFALLELAPKTARLVKGNEEKEIAVSEIVKGDRLRVLSGEKIPVDGKVREGFPSIDESLVTGESVPVEKIPGDSVIGGTISVGGAFLMETTAVGGETLLSQMVKLLVETQRTRPQIQALADRVSKIFVPTVIGLAVLTFFIWYFVGPAPKLLYAVMSAVSVLVIACPCALGIATPMSITVGMGRAATMGILWRNLDAFEKVGKIDRLFVDKTGTLTEGKPEVAGLHSEFVDENELLTKAASAAITSDHPLSVAVIRETTRRKLAFEKPLSSNVYPGEGVVAGAVALGNAKLLRRQGITFKEIDKPGMTLLGVSEELRFLGWIALKDRVKGTSKKAIESLRAKNIETVLLTGDTESVARGVAEEVGIDKFYARLLPSDKREMIKKRQGEGHFVAMAGDGINDAAALAQANVGIAMGSGSDVTKESADIILVHGDLLAIDRAIELGEKIFKNMKQNLFLAFFYNVLCIPIAAGVLFPTFGILLSPMFASFAMSLSSVSVILNALRLRGHRSN